MGREPAVDRHALGEFDGAGFAVCRDVAHGLNDFRHPQGERCRRAPRKRGRNDARRCVERDHPRVPVEHHRRIGQARDHLVEQPLPIGGLSTGKRGIGTFARAVEPAEQRLVSLARHHHPAILAHRYDFGATPSHNSRTPKINRESAKGII